MMNVTLARLLACLTLAGAFGFYRRPAPPDLSSPKAAIRSFADAIKQKDPAGMIACVSGGKDTPESEKVLKNFLTISDFDIKDPVAEVNGDTARVAVEIEAGTEVEKHILLWDTLDLKKEGDLWKIVPNPAMLKDMMGEKAPTGGRIPILKIYAALSLGSDEAIQTFQRASDRAKAISCLSNGKQLSLSVMQYVQDYDERYPLKTASYKDIVMPYIKNGAIFTCPLDPPGTLSYTYNKYMQERSLAELTNPAATIVFYEGKDMKPDFRHDGKAMIAFADGHAKLCAPEDMKDFLWKEEGWTEILPVKPVPKPVAKPKVTPKKKKTKH